MGGKLFSIMSREQLNEVEQDREELTFFQIHIFLKVIAFLR